MSGYGYQQQPYGQQSGPQYHPTQGGYCPPPQAQPYGSNAPAGGYGMPSGGQQNSYNGGAYQQPAGYNNNNSYGQPSGPMPGQASGPAGDRGLMGALAGATAGGIAGGKKNHGFLGAIGGAIAGSMLEDKLKKNKKHGHHH